MYSEQIRYIKSITDFQPEIAIVLGSGLGGLAKKIDTVSTIPYSEIPSMPVSTAPSHKGQFVFGYLGGKKVVLMEGRVHLYEGYTPQEIITPVRILKLLGVKTIILTNAAGGINREYNIGDFMLISDHISCFIDSPLIGKNHDSIGTRFPDMSNAYDREIRAIAKRVAFENDIPLQEGVYVQLKGPQFESPAEIKMLSTLGADAVGMSTAIETIGANHCGLKVCGISMIANMACGILDTPLTSEDVNMAAERSADTFEKLITKIVEAL